MIEPLSTGHVRCLPPKVQQKLFGEDDRFLFARLGVHGDGTCFFHSLCAALNHENYLFETPRRQQDIGHAYRSNFRQHITPERWDKFVKKFDIAGGLTVAKVKQHFHDNKHWADETMIKFVSNVLKLNLIFIDTDNNKLYCGVRGHKDEPLIVILWVAHSHFEPMFRILDEKLDEQKVNGQFQFNLFNDREVVDIIMSNYDAQCST